MNHPRSTLVTAAALALVPLASAQVALNFETAGHLANNFRSIGVSTGSTVAQTSNGAANDFLSYDATNALDVPTGNGNNAVVLLFDTTPGDTSLGTQSTFAVSATNPLTVSFDFRAATANSSVGIVFASPSNASNHVLALFNVDNSGATDRFRFFRDGTISGTTVTAGTQVPAGTNFDRTTTAAVNVWANYSVSLTVSGTTPTVSLTVGGQTVSQTFAAGDFDWTNTTIALRLFDAATNSSGNGIDIDEFNVTSVPEPSTAAALLGLGALGFAALRRRRGV